MKRILYIQYTNPASYPPLEHSSHILAEDGWQILFLGTGALGAASLKFPPHLKITVRQLAFCSPGWRQKIHYVWFCLWVLVWTIRWRATWVYASDYLACPIAVLIYQLLTDRVIYHEHDTPPKIDANFFTSLCVKARRWIASRVDICILPNEQRLAYFKQDILCNGKVLCVLNCPKYEEATVARLESTHQILRLFYHGSIVPSQFPPTVLQAITLLPSNVQLEVVGYETAGHPGYVEELKALAYRLGIQSRVCFKGTVPTRVELLQHCRQSDVGLALFSATSIQPMPGASNKPFDYLACGLAVLVPDRVDWQEMYVKPGYGLTCNPNDSDSITAALKWYLEHSAERQQMGEQGRQQILAEWNYEHQFAVVRQQMER